MLSLNVFYIFQLSSEDEYVYFGKRKILYIQMTKKVGCTAKLFIRYIKKVGYINYIQ